MPRSQFAQNGIHGGQIARPRKPRLHALAGLAILLGHFEVIDTGSI
jgi:hypothetical protein